MKKNVIILITLFTILTAFNIKELYNEDSPSIKIISGEKIGENSYVFSLKMCSDENLVNFKALPSIKGSNNDADFNYDFPIGTKSAVINYFYVVSDNMSNSGYININFILTDNKSVTKLTKKININILK